MVTEKHCRAVVLAAALGLLLTGCGDKLETPEAYSIGDDSTITLDSFFSEEDEEEPGGKLVAIESPEDKEKEKDKDKKKDKDKDKDEEKDKKDEEDADKDDAENGEEASDAKEIYTYTYEEVTSDTLTAFAEALLSEDEGFAAVSDELAPLEEKPDMSTDEGSATFARASVEEGSVFQLALAWSEGGTCTIIVSRPEGEINSAAPTEEPKKDEQEVLTLVETVDYVRTLPPSMLGLEGESMNDYVLLPDSGSPLVDGRICRKLKVYRTNEKTQTNEVMGTYLVGIGRIYKLDEFNRTVTPLN